MCICVCMCMCVRMYVCMYVSVYMCICLSVCIWVFVTCVCCTRLDNIHETHLTTLQPATQRYRPKSSHYRHLRLRLLRPLQLLLPLIVFNMLEKNENERI